MSRKIKFRARDTKNNQWMQFVPPAEYMIDSEDWDRRDADEEGYLFFPQNPMGDTFKGRVVYQQFTGLLDKNKKEIYEGDIVNQTDAHFIDNVFTGTVVYDIPNAAYLLYKNSGQTTGLGSAEIILEVISNIFENQDLLKNEEQNTISEISAS